MAKSTKPLDVDVKVPYREEVSRWFVFRFLWLFPLVPVLWIWMIWIGIVTFLQFWYMLFTGRRQAWLWEHMVMLFRYTTRWNGYFNLVTDKRPLVFDFESKE
jgi:hypothetical protein